MKKSLKYSSALLATLTLCMTTLPSATSVYANTVTNNQAPKIISSDDIPDVYLSKLTPEQNQKLNLMFTIGDELALTDKGELYLKHDVEFLQNNYNLSQDDVLFITGAISNYNSALTTPVYMSRARFDGGYIHLTYDEVLNIVNLAASYGPGVIAGAMAAILSVYPGVGTVIGGAIGWIGAAAILQAMSDAAFQRKGIKIGIGSISAE